MSEQTNPAEKPDAFRVGGRKNSWIPILLAAFGPIVVIVLLYGSSAYLREQQPEFFGPEAPPAGPIADMYFVVRVTDAVGVPVVGRRVSFSQEHHRTVARVEDAPLRRESSVTDSDGIATIVLQKQGSVTIAVDGTEFTQIVSNLERERDNMIEVRIRL